MNTSRTPFYAHVALPRICIVCALGLSFLLHLSSLRAQESENTEEEVFDLSPFAVSGDDTGYYATETLSGTNLRTNMRSLANPITVMTPEVMEDVGATSYKDVVAFMPSTNTYDGDLADPEGEQARTGTPFVTRGFRVTQFTENFLATNVRQDNYNTERLTQSRGPNSLLFGLGSVGGAMDITPIRGLFNSDFTSLNFLFDEFGRARGTFDHNRELIDNKVALRIAAVYDKSKTFRKFEYSRRKGIYSDISYRPFKRTTVRLNGEVGSFEENFPRMFVTKDWITPWTTSQLSQMEKANTTDLSLIADGPPAARNTAGNRLLGVNALLPTSNRLVWVANTPDNGVQNWRFKGHGSMPVINGREVNNLSLATPQLTTDVYFPLDVVTAGPSELSETDYYKSSLTLEQQLAENTFLQLSAAYEDFNNTDYRPVQRGDWTIMIDTNYYLPTQLASDNPNPDEPLNPYFGVPYVESNPELSERSAELIQYRAILSHKINLSSILEPGGFDLGEIQFVGSLYRRESKQRFKRQQEMTLQSLFADGSLNNLQGRIMRRWYLSSEVPHYPDIPWQPIVQAADPSIGGNIVPAVESAFVSRLPPAYNHETTESILGVVQWQLLRQRLSLTAGYREDDYNSKAMTFVIDPVTGLYESFDTGAFDVRSESKVDNYNLGVVVQPLRNLDLFINRSTNNVNASINNFDVLGEFLPPEEGIGMDYGFRAFFKDDRIVVKLNYYENTQKNVISNPLRDGAGIGIPMARQNGRVERLFEALDAGGRNDLTEGGVRYGQYPGNQLWTDIEDIHSKGYELEVVVNLTRSWNLLFNTSMQKTALNSTYQTFNRWYENFVIPVKNDPAALALAEPRFSPRTVQDVVDDIDRKVLYHESQIGGQLLRSSRWAWNLISTYRFQNDGFFRNFVIGTAFRWRQAPSLGYPEDLEGNFDTSRTFKGKDDLTADVWFRKPFRIGRGQDSKVINVTLRVRNVFDDGPFIDRTGVDDGSGNLVILQRTLKPPRSFQLEVGMRF